MWCGVNWDVKIFRQLNRVVWCALGRKDILADKCKDIQAVKSSSVGRKDILADK